jgi:hypothetical protein
VHDIRCIAYTLSDFPDSRYFSVKINHNLLSTLKTNVLMKHV